MPVIERVVAELDVPVSVDTYKPAVGGGGDRRGRVHGQRRERPARPGDRRRVRLDRRGAGDHAHARGAQAQAPDPEYEDVAADVREFLAERMALAQEHGVAAEQIVLDPGPDFAKTPAQTVESLRALDGCSRSGAPC